MSSATRSPADAVSPSVRAPLRASIAEILFRRAVRGAGLTVIGQQGTAIVRGPAGAPTMTIVRPDFFHRLGRDGKIGFGEAYIAGDWQADDLAAVLTALAARLDRLVPPALARFRRLYEPQLGRRDRNTPAGAARNIARHYDLSNDLFAIFLDDTMAYSCALFAPGDSLESAQRRKYERICRLAELTADDHVLEIGTGWGGLAEHMASTRGCRVTTSTLSAAQADWAAERIRRAGLDDRVEVVLADYRDLGGSHTKIVSVEMFEAVGEEYWPAFFAACDRRLAPGGRMVLQTITMPHARYLATRTAYGWIHKYIFPGGLIPSVEAIARACGQASQLRIQRRIAIGSHYARTLELWRQRFLAGADRVRELGFDERFLRMWEFYLAYCQAGFATGALDDEQMVLTREAA
ncbi:MAG TPA: cyclopropane-fatty-acyl-phospholipid synthase family protein [Gaiellales bacterium]|nr:cyclopropane-fatty-acyl-phospholipid synthase family protein [Gaiellales bacterium]